MKPPIHFKLTFTDSKGQPATINLPSVGLGTFDPAGSAPNAVYNSVLAALRAGYRHIDTALRYDDGEGERQVGRAIRDSGVPREEVFVVTKLENTFHASEDVEAGLDMSLENLDLDYVDLYLMHFPYAYKKRKVDFGTERHVDGKPVIDVGLSRNFISTWHAMEQLVDKDRTRAIGVSNFSTPKLRRLLQAARMKPVINQIEVHPYWPQKRLVQFCQEHGVHVTAFGPLGCAPIPALVGRKDGRAPVQDDKLGVIAQKYGKSPAQIILAWLLSRGISVIPKSSNERRIVENLDCLFQLDPADIKTIDDLTADGGQKAVRNLETLQYLGFDNYNETVEEP